MEATLRISLYSYLYLKLAKMLCLSYYLLCFLFNKIREPKGQTGSAVAGRQGGGREIKIATVKQRKTGVGECYQETREESPHPRG
jgi:hypothetical protein